MSNTMTFKLNDSGELSLVKKRERLYSEIKPVKDTSKFSDNYVLSIAPIGMMIGTVGANVSGAGIFWDSFMQYIFPWMLDIAKVFCAIKIAQAFYQERRGGSSGGTGMEAIMTYGRWYLLFVLMPYGVQLIDEIGNRMLADLKSVAKCLSNKGVI